MAHSATAPASQPRAFDVVIRGGTVYGGSEISFGGRKMADLRQIVRTIARADVERDAATVTILPIPERMLTVAKVWIGVAAAIAAFGIIVAQLLPRSGGG